MLSCNLKLLLFLSTIILFIQTKAQTAFADSIRTSYKIPQLAFAVVSADSIYALNVSGVKKINTNSKADINDRFHIGSNTKAITAFIAALLVQQKKISWNTKFLKLFPELKITSKKIYYNITLQDLLTFRGKLPGYTYTNDKPTKKEITGNNAQQRFLLAKYFLSQPPMQPQNGLTPSNADYILAGLMLEKVSGKTYQELVDDFGKMTGIDFGFDYPNLTDTTQTWGHDAELKPVAPFDNYKLNWLLSAGNINVSLPGYIKFIQLQLQGMQGESTMLTAATFNQLLFGLPEFSYGWFNKTDTITNQHIAFNEGNAGAFITRVEIIKEKGMAYIIFTNAATEETKKGIDVLMDKLQNNYK